MNLNPKVYEWDYDGQCAPDIENIEKYIDRNRGFSLGIFQWIPKSRMGLKRGNVIYRVKGNIKTARQTFERANKIIRILNDSFVHLISDHKRIIEMCKQVDSRD